MSYKVLYFDLGGVVFRDFFSGGEVGLSNALRLKPQVILDAYKKTDLPEYCKDELSDETRWKLFIDELGLSDGYLQTCIDEYYRSYQIIAEPRRSGGNQAFTKGTPTAKTVPPTPRKNPPISSAT